MNVLSVVWCQFSVQTCFEIGYCIEEEEVVSKIEEQYLEDKQEFYEFSVVEKMWHCVGKKNQNRGLMEKHVHNQILEEFLQNQELKNLSAKHSN